MYSLLQIKKYIHTEAPAQWGWWPPMSKNGS